MQTISSWGRLQQVPHDLARPAFLDEVGDAVAGAAPALAYGLGRSYGDVCTHQNGRLIVTDRLDRFIAADWERGIVRAEAGLSLDRLLQVSVPRGWFVPVTPGTKFVSLGGAVANDVHGKNHELVGTFGAHVRALGLARSAGERLTASPAENAELFAATVGGLGLTGIMLWVELQLIPIRSSFIEVETLPFDELDGFFRLSEDSKDWTYTVAWVDCIATGRKQGRGLFMRGRHAERGGLTTHRMPKWNAPFETPGGLLHPLVLRAFNALYWRRGRMLGHRTVHYDTYFYPLDSVGGWNKLYGRGGFFQHQSAVPMAGAANAMRRLLELTAEHRQGSSLAVLKLFGDRPSPGLLSFPMHGATLALDFPNKGDSTLRLLRQMEDVVMAAGGRLYPAKDATMSPAAFRAGYPNWRTLEARRDPGIISDFWRRVTADRA